MMLLSTWAALTLCASPAPQHELPQKAAAFLVGAALTDGHTWSRISELTTEVGPRLSGSPGAAAALEWARRRFEKDGLKAHLEPVTVPHWTRGVETGELLSMDGHRQALALTALGGSPGTGEDGVTAEAVEVRSLDELKGMGGALRGKAVFFNHDMATAEDYEKYGGLRMHGPAQAARLGAVAAVVRSLATASLRTPHTGATQFEANDPLIPAAALSLEDADALHRALASGAPVRVHLTLGCQRLPDAPSANVVAEIRGRERPKEVVLLGAHLDSWDLAVGAEDDAAGVAMVMEAAELLAHLDHPPRRTVRFVLFMNEENGLQGGKAYAAGHQAELGLHVAAVEADGGGGRPQGVSMRAGKGGAALVERWMQPLATLGSSRVLPGEAGGADLLPMDGKGVPFLSIHQEHTHYFDFHHSAADTLDKLDPESLAKSAAALTYLTYALAESPELLPRLEK